MFPLFWPMMIGAGIGAASNPQKPLLGALGGAALGGVGGHFLGGAGAAGSTAGQGLNAAAAGAPAASAMFANPTGMGVATEAMMGGVNPAMAAKMGGMPEATAALAAGQHMGAPVASLAGKMSTDQMMRMMMMQQMMQGMNQRRY